MAKTSKALTLARLEDLTLGAFAAVPMTPTFKHLIDYLSTWGGTELSIRGWHHSVVAHARECHQENIRRGCPSDLT